MVTKKKKKKVERIDANAVVYFEFSQNRRAILLQLTFFANIILFFVHFVLAVLLVSMDIILCSSVY